MVGVGRAPRVGFAREEARGAIESMVGWNNANEAVLVGAGNFGTALAGYEGFARHGLKILAAFDADPDRVGRLVHGVRVYPVEKLFDLIERLKVRIAVLTAPAEAAQDLADQLVLAGVRGLWNFTPARLEVPDGVVLENVDLSASLAVLSSRVAEQLRRQP